MKLDSINKVLDFAIEKEQDAADFYTDLASKMKKKNMKEIFEQFALEEKSHKAKLQQVKGGKLDLSPVNQKIMDLKIAETLADVDTDGKFDYQQALIVAMKNEKNSYRLYTDLAGMIDDPSVKQLFLGLAQEEAKHKLRFEIAYDDDILVEN
ncbi:MAG: rubrerythrin [candidate division Zixibacteria bacterium HGW-Zixibacteria-1]|nr:MAG: rubrerythrin [candidate division Zixibacteria bacterium HGW-Zixibacteria-1]